MTDVRAAPPEHVHMVEAVLRGHRRARDTILIDDLYNLEQALRGGVRVTTVFHTPDVAEHLLAVLPAQIPRVALSPQQVTALFGPTRTSRVFALARRPRPARLADLAARRGDILVLDGVRLMGNIGAITRTCAGLGAGGLALIDSQLPAVTDRRLIRASRGLVFSVPVVLTHRQDLLRFLAREGIPLYATTATAPVPIHQLAFVPDRIALALGGEKRGCPPELSTHAAGSVRIPMAPGVESLNVSVVTGIALHCRLHHNLPTRSAA